MSAAVRFGNCESAKPYATCTSCPRLANPWAYATVSRSAPPVPRVGDRKRIRILRLRVAARLHGAGALDYLRGPTWRRKTGREVPTDRVTASCRADNLGPPMVMDACPTFPAVSVACTVTVYTPLPETVIRQEPVDTETTQTE